MKHLEIEIQTLLLSGEKEKIDLAKKIARKNKLKLNLSPINKLIRFILTYSVKKPDGLIQANSNNIGAAISKLSKIKELHIFLTRFQIIKSLPDAFSLLKNLEKLELNISSQVNFDLNLWGLRQLKVLHMNGLGTDSFPKGILQQKKLEELSLSANKIKFIPSEIQALENLKLLNLSFCPFLEVIPDEVLKLPKLEKLLVVATPIKEIPYSIVESNLKIWSHSPTDYQDLFSCPKYGNVFLSWHSYGDEFETRMSKNLKNGSTRKYENIPNNIFRKGTDSIKEYLKNSS